VWIPTDSSAPWVVDFLKELRRFPMAKHDDQVDAMVMALRILHDPISTHYAAAWGKVRRELGRR
jgi:phage terminase large subunit-like protein